MDTRVTDMLYGAKQAVKRLLLVFYASASSEYRANKVFIMRISAIIT